MLFIYFDPLSSLATEFRLSIQTDKPNYRTSAGCDLIKITEMATGTVKCFYRTKGFRFSAPYVGSKDVLVHISAVDRAGLTLRRYEQKVTFDVESDRNGRQSAKNIALNYVSQAYQKNWIIR